MENHRYDGIHGLARSLDIVWECDSHFYLMEYWRDIDDEDAITVWFDQDQTKFVKITENPNDGKFYWWDCQASPTDEDVEDRLVFCMSARQMMDAWWVKDYLEAYLTHD